MNKFFEDLKLGLEEAIAYKKGKIKLRAKLIPFPEAPAEYKAEDIKHIRESHDYSQRVFALILNVSIKTVQSWESGVRRPSCAALRLLEIIDKGIYNPLGVSSKSDHKI